MLSLMREGSAYLNLLLVTDGKYFNPEILRWLPETVFCTALGGLGKAPLV